MDKVLSLTALYCGHLVREVRKRWEWSPEIKLATEMDIVGRACAVVCARHERGEDGSPYNYDDAVKQVFQFVEAYAIGADIKLIPKREE